MIHETLSKLVVKKFDDVLFGLVKLLYKRDLVCFSVIHERNKYIIIFTCFYEYIKRFIVDTVPKYRRRYYIQISDEGGAKTGRNTTPDHQTFPVISKARFLHAPLRTS